MSKWKMKSSAAPGRSYGHDGSKRNETFAREKQQLGLSIMYALEDNSDSHVVEIHNGASIADPDYAEDTDEDVAAFGDFETREQGKFSKSSNRGSYIDTHRSSKNVQVIRARVDRRRQMRRAPDGIRETEQSIRRVERIQAGKTRRERQHYKRK